jgi:ferredoxin
MEEVKLIKVERNGVEIFIHFWNQFYLINAFLSMPSIRDDEAGQLRPEEMENMANENDRLEANAPGPWFVDSSCIDCDLCRETAPAVFRREDAIGYSVVYKQPETPKEREQAEEARLGCPVEAIGNTAIIEQSTTDPAVQAAKPSV